MQASSSPRLPQRNRIVSVPANFDIPQPDGSMRRVSYPLGPQAYLSPTTMQALHPNTSSALPASANALYAYGAAPPYAYYQTTTDCGYASDSSSECFPVSPVSPVPTPEATPTPTPVPRLSPDAGSIISKCACTRCIAYAHTLARCQIRRRRYEFQNRKLSRNDCPCSLSNQGPAFSEEVEQKDIASVNYAECYYESDAEQDTEPVYDMATVIQTDWGDNYHKLRRASALMSEDTVAMNAACPAAAAAKADDVSSSFIYVTCFLLRTLWSVQCTPRGASTHQLSTSVLIDSVIVCWAFSPIGSRVPPLVAMTIADSVTSWVMHGLLHGCRY
ncbi:hypothetical protein CAPTEDRAFT_213833 [Capitella teleta]|uniref:Uncharacterized protein n=1 Tax=Capitella teleta TaxID=283909 RepID=R7UES2_CAPTE|nr:hypothetical protein CAPTEDRAFT_213833 [Capitella teleta]|eukprot:ELU02293.1 hypothetical protein CAPTEDRAFT_213833 [Capitella teleta]